MTGNDWRDLTFVAHRLWSYDRPYGGIEMCVLLIYYYRRVDRCVRAYGRR